MPLPRRGAVAAGVLLLLVVLGLGAFKVVSFFRRDVTPRFDDIAEHYKYGSIGAEARLGIPEPIFQVLPVMFEDLLPKAPGQGYERLGFLYEPGHPLPVGTSVREKPIPLVGLNCAACHTGTLRRTAGARPEFILGAPANRFNSGGFLQFLIQIGQDPRFEAGAVLDAIAQNGGHLSWVDRALYRFVVIPQMKKRLVETGQQFTWLKGHPAFGPGRVDTFNPYKGLLGVDMTGDDSIGTADYPPLFNQGVRRGMQLHWDGNNDSVEERNKSAAIGAGAEPGSLDLPAMDRVAVWIQDLKPPAFPHDHLDAARAERGRKTWEASCAGCHAIGGERVGKVTPLNEVGTDPERLASFNEKLVEKMNTIGTGYPWRFNHFRRTDGYANAPLDGVWARSPYLHNGSVPTLRALLFREERPEVFFRGYDAFDWEKVGYVSSGPEAEKAGFLYDTRLRGNGNGGHLYGTGLPAAEKEDLLEYLKTL